MTAAAESLVRRDRRQTRLAWCYLGLVVAAGVVYVVARSEVVDTAAFSVAGLSCVAALATGLAWHRPQTSRPWWLVLVAAALFLVGAVLRAQSPVGGVPWSPWPDVFSVSGYLVLAAALLGWIRDRGAVRHGAALLDALLVGAGAALAAWSGLVAPTLAAQSASESTAQQTVYALYPVLDAVVLTLLAQLAFTQARAQPAFWFMVSSMAAILVGDVWYAMMISHLLPMDTSFANGPYFLGYAAIGAAALHPSMSRVGQRQAARVTGWSPGRFGAIAGAMLTALAVPFLLPPASFADRIIRALLVLLLGGGVLLRAASAVNRYAAGEAAARHKASHDDLTGLPNRTHLDSYLSAQLAATQTGDERVSVLFMDLDGFKLVNDSYGHNTGDALLVAAAARLRTAVRENEDFVARLGGDEFVIVSRHRELAGAEGLADRIIAAFNEPFSLPVGEVFVSTSVGIAQAGGAYRVHDAESLIRDADTAMYEAKSAGRDQHALFDAGLREAVRRRIETETSLRYALERDELELDYQPIVNLVDRRILGYETLLRWRHPQRGLLQPAEFLTVAEETGLIVPIGSWVLRSAVRQLARWRSDGNPELHMAVNVSARQLRNRALVGTVAAALAETGVPGSALWLELTETAIVQDPVSTEATLSELCRMGVTVCVDDFGTGYSGLGYLKRFPISIVKIDRSFVSGLGDDPDDRAIVRAVVAMAHALGLRAIGEGVEEEAQERELRILACDMAQGWRYGRPLAAELVEARVPGTTVPLAS